MPVSAPALDQLNRHPVNVAALKWLREAGQTPSPQFLHLHSLVRWAIDQDLLEGQPGVLEAAQGVLAERSRNPESIMSLLTEGREAPLFESLLTDPESAETPAEAASAILDALVWAMRQNDPTWP